MRKRWRLGAAFGIVASACLALGAGEPAGAQGVGTLDTSFGTNGVATSALGAQADAMAVVPAGVSDAGDIVLAATPGGNTGFQAARFTASGSLDTAFGGSGVVEAFTSGQADGVAVVPAGLPHAGDVVVVGRTNSYSGCSGTALVVSEYTPGGTLDTTFDPAGSLPGTIAVDCATGTGDLTSVALDDAGNIVTAGYVTPLAVTEPVVARLTPAGALDAGFGGSGVLVASEGSGNAQFSTVAIEPVGATGAGDIVAAGFDLNAADQTQEMVIAFTSGGGRDASFGCPASASGLCVVAPPTGTTGIAANGETLLPSGAVVLAGTAALASGSELAVVQLAPGGSLDSGFGSGGVVLANPSPGATTAVGVSFESGNNVLLVGGSAGTGAATTGLAAELNAGNGGFDTSFGSNGIALQQAIPGQSTTVYAEATLSNSDVLLAGAFATQGSATSIGVMRLLGVAVTLATTTSTVTANSSGGASITVTVQLNQPSNEPTQVQVCSSAGVVNGSGSCATVTIPAGSTSVSAVVAITNACSPGGSLPVSITISNVSSGATIGSETTEATTVVCPLPAGYWLVASDGGIFSYGQAPFFGSTGGMTLNQPIVGMAATPDAGGYWLVASDGGIFNYGDAPFDGSTGGMHLNKPIVGMAPTPSGKGYWLVASDGGIFSYGDAQFFGSTGGMTLNKPIVGMAATPDGNGYWLVASDGGIFSYGDAQFYGSTGGITLNKPVVGMAATTDGKGYWLVASDGGIFNYGDAPFDGSTGGVTLNKPVVGMALDHSSGGYWLVASDGGIFNYGGAPFYGSTGGLPLNKPVVGMAEG
ncbi:MAG TPA: hypothetical protein VGG09_12600 [Acidimicrobiales bacterium]|jgi:uncharacterized delta-60 repeat protein